MAEVGQTSHLIFNICGHDKPLREKSGNTNRISLGIVHYERLSESVIEKASAHGNSMGTKDVISGMIVSYSAIYTGAAVIVLSEDRIKWNKVCKFTTAVTPQNRPWRRVFHSVPAGTLLQFAPTLPVKPSRLTRPRNWPNPEYVPAGTLDGPSAFVRTGASSSPECCQRGHRGTVRQVFLQEHFLSL